MAEELDRISEAIREIAREDGDRAPREMDVRVRAALRPGSVPSATAAFSLAPGRLIGWGLAATLTIALAGALWLATRTRDAQRVQPATARGEIATSFMPLMYSGLPYTEAHIVRIEVPREALRNFGLAPTDYPADTASATSERTVLADVLVGEDGLARAVRFVRAERAPGVAP